MQERLSPPEAADVDVDYVINLGISLLHAAIGRDITITDPVSGEEETYKLWQK
ncbi:hypothetical protein acdb102_39670 [Acidothermaceae bacterium B102]|nr:hypothetical protein acdb102_39670 [Acidothermaceae bacterium B102]